MDIVKAVTAAIDAQMILDIFMPHEVAAWRANVISRRVKSAEQSERRELALIRKDQDRHKALDSVSVDVLDLPFGNDPDLELSDLGDPYAEIQERASSPDLPEESQAWTEDAIAQLHEGLVHYSLRLLKARGNGREKKEILRWIFLPDAMAYLADEASGKKVWKVINPSETPFGFELCCRFAGYDPERVREGLMPVLKNLGLDELFKELNNDADESKHRSQAEALQSQGDVRNRRSLGQSHAAGHGAGAVGSAARGPVLRVRDGAPA